MLTRTLAAVGTATLLMSTLFAGSAIAADTPEEVVEAQPITGPYVPGPVGETSSQAISVLPFDFEFQMCCSLDSRQFQPPGRGNAGKACVELWGTKSDDPSWRSQKVKVIMWDEDGIDGKKGPTVDFKLDQPRKYCWTSLTVAHPHHFEIQKPWGPAQLWGKGKATGS
ncbi:hypothetical protein SAMN04488564_1021017 [Lentzea waywayandensis]|uniref:Uncharacterized protein n=1 Tax=Lentzea waywayandensis TaxID=84724 RepID=A0A1I6DM86_9PSEU|nr:hypothetical protein [Lentzea waywayandensis]SFR06501.1 hypothetical protein SAMN04488564_1021017 [Lentzea waywayandensis]